ncbi:MAG: trypsin-like peptidase domain-containing protein [Lachnospiraceae bacterium]|nr:trypsin-like peptidase domain-containing protein [Lachnospiraceae bacterium]
MKALYRTIFIGVFCGLLIAGALFAYNSFFGGTDKNETIGTETNQTPDDKLAPSETPVPTLVIMSSRNDVSDISEGFMPAVVAVNVKAIEEYQSFFGIRYENEYESNGSGILVSLNDNELLIVTNNHVVKDATSVAVTFIDDTVCKATVKAVEESADLAVLAVNFSDLSKETIEKIRIATIGDSSKLEIGEMVVAIGNALGYGQSTTVGYVSALDRKIEINGSTLTLIQTDAAINPGNSGGALLNSRGELIGINNAKLADDSIEGMCFAIPISRALPIIEELFTRVEIPEGDQAYLGIVSQTISEAEANAFNMPVGVYIKEVVEDSAADKAGLKQGHIIVKINDKTVTSDEELARIFTYTKGNTQGTVTVMVLENGVYVEKTYDIVFGKRKDKKK